MNLSKEKNYLLYLLAKQDYSRKQLSDKRFARAFILSEVLKLRGKKRIINTEVRDFLGQYLVKK